MTGYIYIAINNSMPNLIKIGYSEHNPLSRLNQLYSTGVPEPFKAIVSFYVNQPKQCEEKIHKNLTGYRVNDQREFFKIEPSQAVKLSINTILQFIPKNSDLALNKDSIKPPMFDEDQTFALQQLIEKDYKNRGMLIDNMRKNGHWANELELEYKLLGLKDEGLVEEIKQHGRYPSVWRITSLGVRFMIENNLVHDSVLKEFD